MVGSRTAPNPLFRRPSARLAFLMDVIPARLTWLLFALSAALLGEDGGAALRVGWREGHKHPARNEVWGSASMAGALGIQLGGGMVPDGGWGQKPLVGDPIAPIDPGMVPRAVRIMIVAGLHAAGLSWAGRLLILGG